MEISEAMKKTLVRYQVNEITESRVYAALARREKDVRNREVLETIAAEERGHYDILTRYTGCTPPSDSWTIKYYSWIARLFGITFAIKLMEKNEGHSRQNYAQFTDYPELQQISDDEERHEAELIGLINEERLAYMGSVVLGLNDALVEFTGALAGFTLALSDSKLIALTGSITGIAAALSMASSEYLSTKSEGGGKHPVKAAVYTGIAYLFTVAALVGPFIVFSNVLIALAVMLGFAVLIIALFNYYYSVARDESFKKRFTEMAMLSFGVAALSFGIGYLLKLFTGIEA